MQLGVGDPFQIVADRAERAERGQARFEIAAVHLEVLAGQGLEQGVGLGVDGAALEQDPPQVPGLVGDPGGEGGHQRLAIDEVVLQGEEAEQQIVVRAGPGPGGPRRGRAAPKTVSITATCSGNRHRYSSGVGRSPSRRR